MGGMNADLGRTQHFLEEVFQSGAATCLICIGSVKRIDPVSLYGFSFFLVLNGCNISKFAVSC